jgi:uncharacterized protein (TIGR02646 family)
MIQIRKLNAPAVLTNRGTLAAAKMHDEYARIPNAYRQGRRHFTFEGSIYAHVSVKEALLLAQHDKCAFCESMITHISYGDIEHFRPKGAVRQHEFDPLQYPGYYWLAYEWSNLFLSCQLCNQRFKRNCFPLRNPKHRARSHRGNLNRESPLLIDPTGLPDQHLTFEGETAVARDNSEVGRVTIEVLGLNRDELRKQRRERRKVLITLQKVQAQLLTATHPSPEMLESLREIRTLLEAAITDYPEYAAMARVTLG